MVLFCSWLKPRQPTTNKVGYYEGEPEEQIDSHVDQVMLFFQVEKVVAFYPC